MNINLGAHSTEEALALLTHQPQVRFPASPWNFHDVAEVYRQHLEGGNLEYGDGTI